MSWRLLEEDGASAAAGLATDELLARRVGAGTSPATLRLYTYRPHCALVGRFQNVAHEVHVPYCSRNGIELNRRPTGGGAILMGPDQLGIALLLRGRGDGMHGHARTLMERFSQGIVGGLAHLGVTAGFRGKNDLEVGGRKIAGLGIHRDPGGGLLFHASVLVDLDVALMVRVLRLPSSGDTGLDAPDLDAAELTTLESRTTTVRACLGRAVAMAEVRGRIASGFASAFEVSLEAGELDTQEQAGIAALEREKYAMAAWLWQETEVADASGVAAVRTPGGTVEARVSLAGRMLKAVHVRGDFFESSAAIADLEARLRWRPADTVAASVAEWAAGHPVETVPPEAFARAIAAAVEDALRGTVAPGGPERGAAPYGCFVSPGAERG